MVTMARRVWKPLSDRADSIAAVKPTPGPVLGIDPGLERTGYALLADAAGGREARLIEAGVVRLPRTQSLEARLVHLQDSLHTLIRTHGPALLACEELYAHYRHPRTAILMGHARGVILAAAARDGLDVLSIAATHVKKVLTGSGHAAKHQVQFAVAALLRLPQLPEPPDVADAIAIALCGLRLRRMPGWAGSAGGRKGRPRAPSEAPSSPARGAAP